MYQSDYKTTQESKSKMQKKRSTKNEIADSLKCTKGVKYTSGTFYWIKIISLPAITCSESTIETLYQCVKYVQC